MIIYATLMRAGLEAAITQLPDAPRRAAAYPDELYTNAAKYHGAASSA